MAATHPISRSERQHERRQTIDRVLATTREVLDAGVAIRLPIVQTAFGSAAKIVEISQKVRANQDELVELAEESCRLIYGITLKLEDMQEIEPNLEANLKELLYTLQSIQTFGEKCAARGTIKAVLMFGFDINEIKAQRRKLKRCMRLFEFQSLLDLRKKTNELIEQHRQNGGVRVLRENGVGHLGTNPENTSNGVNKISISIGDNANLADAIGIAIGKNHEINVNVNN